MTVIVNFPHDMDISVTPPVGAFSIIVDGVPKVPASTDWDESTIFELTYNEAVLGPTVVQLSFPALHANFRSPQMFQVQPFLITGVEIP